MQNRCCMNTGPIRHSGNRVHFSCMPSISFSVANFFCSLDRLSWKRGTVCSLCEGRGPLPIKDTITYINLTINRKLTANYVKIYKELNGPSKITLHQVLHKGTIMTSTV